VPAMVLAVLEALTVLAVVLVVVRSGADRC
jgi:hypothetical protein